MIPAKTTPAKVLVINKYGPELAKIARAVRPFGLGLLWTESLKDGLHLLKEAQPVLALVGDELEGLDDPTRLLKFVRDENLPVQLAVMTSRPDFNLAMDWVTEGVFAVVASTASMERLRRLTAKALEDRRLFESLTAAEAIPGRRVELELYRELAGHLEAPVLLKALCETAQKHSRADRAEAWCGLDLGYPLTGASAGGEVKGEFEVNLDLAWEGRSLGALKLTFAKWTAAAKLDRERLDELVKIASVFLSQSVKYEEAIKMASRDPLTGLSNRRIFLETLEREFGQAKRHDTPLSLLTLDLDHFKDVNDAFGHQTGDEILKWLSLVIGSVIRTGDLAARVGGEEFAVVLPRTTIIQAQALALRLKEELASSPLPECPGLSRPTVSQGVAGLEHFLVESPQDLIYWSDQAMYLAKRNGRDAVRLVSDIQGPTKLQDAQHVFQ